jgi:hypothetical protein
MLMETFHFKKQLGTEIVTLSLGFSKLGELTTSRLTLMIWTKRATPL